MLCTYRRIVKRILLFLTLITALLSGHVFAFSQGFIQNKGQWDAEVLYARNYLGGRFYLDYSGFTLLTHDEATWSQLVMHNHDKRSASLDPVILKTHVLKMTFMGSSDMSHQLEASGRYSEYHNYFIGNNQKKWYSKVPLFSKLYKKNLYPGIDLEILETEKGVKYNFILSANASIEQIAMKYEGHEDIKIEQGRLKIKTSIGWIEENIPLSYHLENGLKVPAEVYYEIDSEGVIRFRSRGLLKKVPLIIDPELIFSTYSGSTVDNFGFTATFDEDGHLYAGGIATSPYDQIPALRNGRFPSTAGAYQSTFAGGVILPIYGYSLACDISISKYSADGKQLLYATYLGGVNNEYPHSLIVNDQNELIVFGTSMSVNYPVTVSAYQPFYSDSFDMIITRFSADGSRLMGSTYFGGSGMDGVNEAENLKYFYADNFRGEVNIDAQGNILIASSTSSNDLKMSNGAFQTDFGGGYSDGILLKFKPDLSDLIFGSYLGGNGNDGLYSVDVHPSGGDIYLSGGTSSTGLGQGEGLLNATYSGRTDGFIATVSATGNTLSKYMYWGTARYDQIFALDFDRGGNVYVIGQSEGSMPIQGEVYVNANSGVFVSSFTKDLSSLRFSTTIGSGRGVPDITINAFMVDECGKIYASGWGGASSLVNGSSTRNLPTTADAAYKTTDGSDFYLFVLEKDARQLLYATYMGGNRTNDHVDGGTSRFDKRGAVYQSVCASCPDNYPFQSQISDFPTTSGAFSERNPSPRCSNASFKFEFGNINLKPVVNDTFMRVGVFDTLDFEIMAYDQNGDSIELFFFLPEEMRPYLIQGGERSIWPDTARHRFRFVPACEMFTGDTLKIPLLVTDRGCPYREDSLATISILVDPPPLMPPPEVLCLTFENDDEYVRLRWEDVYSDKYFKTLYLYRIDPDGSTKMIDSASSAADGEYLDMDLVAPTKNNYQYFIRVLNKCNQLGDTSYVVSSSGEFIAPIKTTNIYTVTVEENDFLSVQWFRSEEEDFNSYELYRKKQFGDKTEDWQLLKVLENRDDTFFHDRTVNVHEDSYCYRMRIRDNCGHVSQYGDFGCSMVLRGDEPPFAFNLYWNPYEGWEKGIQRFEMFSMVDTGILRKKYDLPASPSNLYDDELNYDWGGYWYQVKALEGENGFGAVSWSNAIYLIQPPLLHVPNAFTPNGDGLNELWGIVPVFVKEYDLKIYDRWGGKVFETQNKHEIWDGFANGSMTPQSVYVYQIKYTGWDRSVHYVKGTVTILK